MGAAGPPILWAVGSPFPFCVFPVVGCSGDPVIFPMSRAWSTVNLHLHVAVMVPDAKALQPLFALGAHLSPLAAAGNAH